MPASWFPGTPGNIIAAILAYLGGILTKPLTDNVSMPETRYDLRLCLYGEVARIYSRYEHLVYHSSLPITVRSKTDAYRTAMQVPEMYYRLREKHFFDGLYRTMLGFDSERAKRPVRCQGCHSIHRRSANAGETRPNAFS